VTLALVAGMVSVVALTLLARPFLAGDRTARASGDAPGAGLRDVRTQLLRQVRDLDDDLAAGKISTEQHATLRRALEAELAPLLRRGRAPERDAHAAPPQTRSPRTARRRWLRRVVSVAAVASVVSVTGVVLDNAVEPKPQAPAAPPATVAAGPDGAFVTQPTADQLGAVDAAVKQVRRAPRSVSAHLALAHAYTGAGQPQLATVEYLATTRLAPGNAEANTALALVAFTSRNAEQAKEMVDRALRTRPGYPEALYVRGLVLAMGLKRPAAAERDFRAYLEAAPYGSHRATVKALLELVGKDGGR
jgi:tetratricopeptide (TPR) repeat protein